MVDESEQTVEERLLFLCLYDFFEVVVDNCKDVHQNFLFLL